MLMKALLRLLFLLCLVLAGYILLRLMLLLLLGGVERARAWIEHISPGPPEGGGLPAFLGGCAILVGVAVLTGWFVVRHSRRAT